VPALALHGTVHVRVSADFLFGAGGFYALFLAGLRVGTGRLFCAACRNWDVSRIPSSLLLLPAKGVERGTLERAHGGLQAVKGDDVRRFKLCSSSGIWKGVLRKILSQAVGSLYGMPLCLLPLSCAHLFGYSLPCERLQTFSVRSSYHSERKDTTAYLSAVVSLCLGWPGFVLWT